MRSHLLILLAFALATAGSVTGCEDDGGASEGDNDAQGGQLDGAASDADRADGARPDAAPIDAGDSDAAQLDAARPDAGELDAARPDAGELDAAQTDAAQTDAAQTDAAQPDAAQPDAEPPGACEGLAEGAVLSVGMLADCAYADACAEAGTQSRVNRICRDGVPADQVEALACARETDGTVLEQGAPDACAFADACAETGTQRRQNRICREGVPVDEAEDLACARDTDGAVLAEGVYDLCAFADACAETGARSRINQVCRNGTSGPEVQTEACVRETDGTQVSLGQFGLCTFANVCIEMGTQERPRQVCRHGASASEPEIQACARDTDGTIVGQGGFGECVFDDLCDQTGSQRRDLQVCRDGVSQAESQSQACNRNTNGRACQGVGSCFDGACACPAAQPTVCAGLCVQTDDDARHCGACNDPCGAGERCQVGVCVLQCGDGVRDPGEECDDGNFDESDGCARCRDTLPDFCAGACDVDGTVTQALPVRTGVLTASDAAAGTRFGFAVAASGDWGLVGRQQFTVPSAAYLFRRGADGQWTEAGRLLSTDYENTDQFGMALALEDTVAVVGAPKDDHVVVDGGAVYVFARNGQNAWVQVQKLIPPLVARDENFGAQVALRGNRLIASALDLDTLGGALGVAYIYERNAQGQWAFAARITGSQVIAGHQFGFAVAIDGDVAVVGAPGDDAGGSGAGAAYVFTRTAQGEWRETSRVLSSQPAALQSFGRTVAIGDGQVFVGAPNARVTALNNGSVYRFQRNGAGQWVSAQRLIAADPQQNGRFGYALSLAGGNLAVGAIGQSNVGAVSVFRVGAQGNWSARHRVDPSTFEGGQAFGSAVATDGQRLWVGDHTVNVVGAFSGRAEVFDLYNPTCTRDGRCLCVEEAAGPLCDASAP